MPIPNEYRDICKMLLDATIHKRVNWVEQAGGFAVHLPEFNLELWNGTDEQSDRQFVAMGLRDPKGTTLIDSWYLDEADVDFKTVDTLCDAARRQARRVPEKLQGLRDLLTKGKRVGFDEDDPSS
jgi:hypothetical protein